ncbi:stage III sporulation protein AF [Thermoanaerobacterium sp. RBIITD]|uniref:stage III sporulation protein AF n=1 Tax=Thermoanaerobacterium sp. RBIITD TaxID=1550240 RepID=UPI000BB79563|nr:stage III sporulation protein AF [Thermoanaerobacterium sp. RBIITD]SNX55363.1 stage III sporulation protein AF [Thermoanaerobacterium sp. RBIITD]
MEMIKNWILQIAYISILAVIFEFMVPSSSIKKYVKVVIGLIIMMTIINPILTFLKGGIDINSAVLKNEYGYNDIDINSVSKQAEVERNKLIVDEYKRRLNEQIKERILTKVDAANVQVDAKIDNDINDKYFGKIESLDIKISNVTNEKPNTKGNVDKVVININQSNDKKNNIDDIKNDISTFYNVPLKNITIEEK